ncbi:MAG: hypothetical protein HY926_09610 [Elusimicrobia bacterium]|nr:hypothetical protein [Elusimicrobiota bacterium]
MPSGKVSPRWTLAAILALALLIRLSTWPAIFQDGRVFFLDGDDYYHLRRMMTAAAGFPWLPAFDRYIGYPAGSYCRWPPLHDWLGALLGLILGLGRPSQRLLETVAAFLPPAAGLAALFLFYRAAAAVLSRRAALLSLAVAAVLPLPAAYTLLGRPDHHCVENLWFLAALLCCLKLLAGGGRACAWAAGTALAMGSLSWFGFAYFSLILFAFLAAERALRPRESLPGLRHLPLVFLSQVPILLLVCGANHWVALRSFDFDAPSLFQPVLLAALGAWALCLRDRAAVWGGLALALSLVLAYAGVPSLASFFAAPAPVFKAVEELRPLFGRFPDLTTADARDFFGWALWLVLPLAVFFARESWTPARRLVLSWLLATGALTLVQLRYGAHFSLPAALVLGWGLDRLWGRLGWKAAAAVVLLWPALRSTASLHRFREGNPGSAELAAACDWIRLHTPPTRSLWKDEGEPEYGVFSLHDVGAQVAALAQRPAAAGNLHWCHGQIAESLSFFFATDPAQAYEFLARRGFRYVLLTDMFGDGSLSRYASLYRVPLPPRAWDLVAVRLYAADGSLGRLEDGSLAEPVERFRLVYESPAGAGGLSRWKLFELVPGALLEGECRSGLPVTASVPQRSVQGRSFTYVDWAACGADRRFRMRLPYPGLWTVAQKGLRRGVRVEEPEVAGGKAKRLSGLR